jgi:hypothetical protein
MQIIQRGHVYNFKGLYNLSLQKRLRGQYVNGTADYKIYVIKCKFVPKWFLKHPTKLRPAYEAGSP